MSVLAHDTRPPTVESYRVSGRTVLRDIVRRDGSVSTSSQHLADGRITGGDAVTLFDDAWLRRVSPPEPTLGDAVSVVDLFAGCGGLSLGAHEAVRALGGVATTSLAVELDPVAAAVFADNFSPTELVTAPVETLVDGLLNARLTTRERRLRQRLDGLTLLLAGPPCQGNSDLNNHTRRRDPKNSLYLRAARFAEVVRPDFVMIENVPGVMHDRSGVVPQAVAALEKAGYAVSTGLVRSDVLGWAQARRRHFLLASRSGTTPSVGEIERDFARAARPVLSVIRDLVDGNDGVFDTPATHSLINQRRIDFLFDHDVYDLPDALRPDCHRLKRHSYRAVYGRMHPDRPAPTITAGFGSTGQGRFVHPTKRRTLTPHEAARVQGFPDFFSFASASGRRALQQMIGNAVPTRLAFAATASLLR